MARKKAPPPQTIGKDRVTIRVYPFAGQKPIAGWIESGMLDTVAGGPARGARVEIDRPDKAGERMDDYLSVIRCLDRQGYKTVIVCFADGLKYDMRTMTAVQ